MALLDDVKLALRISHNKLDSEITSLIASAREDMQRAGMTATAVADETSNLTTSAIKTYVLMRMADNLAEMEGYQRSYETQLDNLRKSSAYNTDPEPNPDPDPDPDPEPEPDVEPESEPEPDTDEDSYHEEPDYDDLDFNDLVDDDAEEGDGA